MNPTTRTFLPAVITIIAAFAGTASADDIRIAVASNFSNTLKPLAEQFTQQTGHRVIVIPGATGKHYAQISNGAPFDIFLAADQRRPASLEQRGMAVPGSRFCYATGKLVLWSPDPTLVDNRGEALLKGDFRHLAIANPTHAPYGSAALEVIKALGRWPELSNRLARGENINQAFQFVTSGNAELGLIALSQLTRPGHRASGSFWLVPQTLYSPIEQHALLLRDRPAAHAFLAFLRTEPALAIIRGYGYDTPHAQ